MYLLLTMIGVIAAVAVGARVLSGLHDFSGDVYHKVEGKRKPPPKTKSADAPSRSKD